MFYVFDAGQVHSMCDCFGYRYNSKTYMVTDIDFEVSPRSTFESRDGDVSYKDYYQKVTFFEV